MKQKVQNLNFDEEVGILVHQLTMGAFMCLAAMTAYAGYCIWFEMPETPLKEMRFRAIVITCAPLAVMIFVNAKRIGRLLGDPE